MASRQHSDGTDSRSKQATHDMQSLSQDIAHNNYIMQQYIVKMCHIDLTCINWIKNMTCVVSRQ